MKKNLLMQVRKKGYVWRMQPVIVKLKVLLAEVPNATFSLRRKV